MSDDHTEQRHAVELRLRWLAGADGPIAAAVASPDASSTVGVVIIPSIGPEANLMRPAIADMARALAAAGAHAVAVQLAGADQSYGTLRTPDLVNHWRASVAAGIAQIRAMGVPRPYVIACRLGATLLSGAIVGSASGVVLWSPTTSGRRLVRELRLLQAGADYAGDRPDEVNVAGYAFPSELLDAVAELRVDAGDLHAARRLLIVDDEHRPCDRALIEALAGSPCEVTYERVDDLGGWVDIDPESSSRPGRSVATISDWILDPRSEARTAPSLPRLVETGDVTAVVDGISEEFVVIGARGLAGVYHQGDTMRPALLIVSTTGPGRQFLELARAEARTGRTVLRFDLAGTGWSDPTDDGEPPFAYDVRSLDDVVAAADWLAAQTSGPILAIGFCAGGRALVEAAAYGAYDHVVGFNVELFEPMRTEPPVTGEQSRRRLTARARKLWRAVGERRRTRRAIRRAMTTGTDLRLVYHEAWATPRYLRTLASGRSMLAGRRAEVSVRVLRSLGHNFEGPEATEAIDEVTALLERLDRSDSVRTRRGGSSLARVARRLGATVAIAALDLAAGSAVPPVPESEVAAAFVEAVDGVVRPQRRSPRRRPRPTVGGRRRSPSRYLRVDTRHGGLPTAAAPMDVRPRQLAPPQGGWHGDRVRDHRQCHSAP